MKTVFVDVDTQLDFLFPSGALYVPGAEHLLPVIARLNQFAQDRGIPLISTTDAHAENDPEFATWPPHCIAGTTGQHKPPATLLGSSSVQVIVEKQSLDALSVPVFRALLDRFQADSYVVYGVATDYCVRFAALGLLATGKPVTLVTDAVAAVNLNDGEATLHDFTARGGTLTSINQLTASL